MASKGFFLPPQSLFGAGCLDSLGAEIAGRGWKKALLVSGQRIAASDAMKKMTAVLDRHGVSYALFSDVRPNPDTKNVADGVRAFQENDCDFLLALGGGSSNDCAKAIGIVAANGGDIHDYQGADKSALPAPPIVAVNTTAGTASEISRAYLISDDELQTKLIMKDRNCMPAIAVNDPELMADLPAGLTASTGMDALTHAVEAYVSTRSYPLTERLAREAADCIFTYLPRAVEDPHDMQAREQMTYGQYMAGMAFGNGGLGLVHAMAHPLGAVFRLGHGICNAVLLPYVCRFNAQAVESKYAELYRFLFPEADELSDTAACARFIEALFRLSERIGTRSTLSNLGVTEADIPLLAEKALQDGNLASNPIQPTAREVEALYRQAL